MIGHQVNLITLYFLFINKVIQIHHRRHTPNMTSHIFDFDTSRVERRAVLKANSSKHCTVFLG